MIIMSTRKRWVTPSFDSFSSDVPPPKKSAAKKVSVRDSPSLAPLAIPSREHKSKMWLEKYQPTTVEELVVHPKKIKEVEQWFCDHVANHQEKYLLLHGPCGCGKTVTLRAMAKKFNFDIVEWITPLDRDYDPNLHGDDQTYQSAAEVFEQFLSRATRYPSLLNLSTSKLILVKDFPNVFIQRPHTLHDMLRKYLLVNTYPIVFICNSDSLARTLLPELVRKECYLRTINFNPVHCKAVIQALERILDLECKHNPSIVIPNNINLDVVYQNSGGDLRSAILKLYFNVTGGCGEMAIHEQRIRSTVGSRQTTTTKKGGKITATKKSGYGGGSCSIGETDKDANTDLFQMLGRVIYSAREYSDPSHRSTASYRFVHDPNELANISSSQPFSFVSFLQENYVSRFSSIKSVSQAADRLRHADVLLSNVAHKEINNVMALSIAIRGLMVANNEPVKSFRPFVKWRDDENALRTHFSDEIRAAFPQLEHSPRDIVLYTLPLLNQCPGYEFNDVQRKVISRASFRK